MSYISHVDYKKMMDGFKKGTPKQMLNEELEQEGNAFTAGLAKAKKGQEFKVGGKSVKDTSNYDAPVNEYQFDDMYPDDPGPFESKMEESHPGMDKWYEDFENGLQNLVKNGYIHKNQYKYFHDALDHVDPMQDYGHMPAHDAAKEFVDDLRTKDAIDHEEDQWKQEHGGYDAGGDDFNDGEFWENEVKKLQEIAGVKPQDDGPEDDNDEEREHKAKKAEMDDEDAENAERDEVDEEMNPTKSYHGSTANQGDTGWTIDFTVIENTPEYFKIDYVMTPNSGNAPRGASRNYRPEKKYGEWKISKVGDKGQPLTDYEKTQLNIKGDHFGVNGKEFVQDIYGSTMAEIDEEGASDGSNMRSEREAAKVVAQKHPELKQLYDKYEATKEEYAKMTQTPNYPNTPEFQAFSKERNAIWKKFENDAINWCGHEMLEAGMNKVQVRNLLSAYGYFEDWVPDYLQALSDIYKSGDMEEGLHMPPLQATGPTVDVNEDQAPFGMSVLSPDERKQLKEYINSYKTIKSEITKLLEKAGKPGKIMENAKKAEDETVPAERKAKYKDPTTVPTHHKHSNLGGNRTGLVMTKAEMWENEGHEEGEHERIEGMLDTKLHDAFHKVTGMIMKDLMADGFDEGDIKNFLQHEIDEKAKEAAMSQYDPH